MMKKLLALLAILVMACSSVALAEDAPPAESPPAESPPSEPAPAPEAPPTEPNLPPALPPTEPQPPTGEQPLQPAVIPSGTGEPASGGEGGSIPSATVPGRGGCWVGENQVPCPGEGQDSGEGRQPQQQPGTNFMNPQNIPPGCKQENNNGMINIVCDNAQRSPEQMACTPGPERERIEQKCKEQGGKIITRNVDPSKGCGIVDCVFGQHGGGNFMPGQQQQQCPGPDELAKKEEACKSMGLSPKRMRSNCEYVQCEDSRKYNMECPDNHAEWERVGMECSQKGGKVVKAFDQNGCNIPQCVAGGEQCQNNVPQEAYFKCEDQGGKLVVNSDENGCITFSKCVKRGEAGVEAEDYIDEVPPAAKLLSVALKLESIKISFDQMAKQISAIADYYNNEGDTANAERFQRAAGMFESAKKQIDGVKEELKMAARGMSKEQLMDIKHKIRQISDVVMEDALYVILGGEDIASEAGYEYKPVEREEDFEGYVPKNEKDCGSDGMCFEKAFRICEKGATTAPERNVNLKIVGIEEGACLIKGSASTPDGEADMTCRFTDYATMPMSKETFLLNCEGSMIDFLKQNMKGENAPRMVQAPSSKEQVFQSQMMGCEKVDKGINKQGVCGNECCEARFGESSYNCPQDCMASQRPAGQNQRQPFVEKAQQVFQQGGMDGCADEKSGESPKDVCGNECCEPGESPENCPKDCNAMQRQPMPDNGQFFNEQRGPAPTGQEGQFGMNPEGQYNGEQTQRVEQMLQVPMIQPNEQPTEPAPVERETVITEPTSAEEPVATESSSGGGGGLVTGAVVAIDLLKEFLGR